jgi:hypothetical protein
MAPARRHPAHHRCPVDRLPWTPTGRPGDLAPARLPKVARGPRLGGRVATRVPRTSKDTRRPRPVRFRIRLSRGGRQTSSASVRWPKGRRRRSCGVDASLRSGGAASSSSGHAPSVSRQHARSLRSATPSVASSASRPERQQIVRILLNGACAVRAMPPRIGVRAASLIPDPSDRAWLRTSAYTRETRLTGGDWARAGLSAAWIVT